MIQKMLTSALFAGSAAGLLAATLHFAFIQQNILLAEVYESAAAEAATAASAATTHSHDTVAAPTTEATTEPAAHDHATDDHGDAPAPFMRNALTALFSGVVYIAYALMLVAGFGVASVYGKTITARDGILWGIAGFAACQLAPAMGLAPELPGTLAADLASRQLWWAGTAAATATGLALLGYGRGPATFAAAIALIAAPHLIGAPELAALTGHESPGLPPPELAAAFSARVLGVGLAVWATLGWLAGRIWSGKPA
jgi:cobalt transporter subunit CbtA